MSERTLGLPSATALVIASMIGAGVFTTSGFALADLGSREAVLLAWVVGGALAMCGALCYGALGRLIPASGGEYTFLSRTVHPLAGFLAGFVSLLVGFTAPIAAAGLGLQAYLAGSIGADVRPEWIGTVAIGVAGLVHAFRLQAGIRLQNAAVALKLVVMAAFVVLAVVNPPVFAEAPAASASWPSLGAFAVTLVWVSFAYSGWNAAVYVGGEVRDPERNIGRALVLATAVVMVIYVALNTVFVYSAPIDLLAGKAEIGAVAAESLGGPAVRRAFAALVALALFTSISSMVMAGPRVYAKMAADGLFPRFLRQQEGAPAAAIAVQVGLAWVVLWASDLAALLGYIGFTLSLSTAATVIALVVWRLRKGAEQVPIPGFPWIPGVFVVATLAIGAFMAAREPVQAGLGLLTLALGALVYAAVTRSRTTRGEIS